MVSREERAHQPSTATTGLVRGSFNASCVIDKLVSGEPGALQMLEAGGLKLTAGSS